MADSFLGAGPSWKPERRRIPRSTSSSAWRAPSACRWRSDWS